MIDRRITYYPSSYGRKVEAILPPKLTNIVLDRKNYKDGSKPEENMPSNVIPFPIKPGTEQDWMKKASVEDYQDILFRIYGNKVLELSEEELKELLEYTINTGAFSG
jgi:hypothetical protein